MTQQSGGFRIVGLMYASISVSARDRCRSKKLTLALEAQTIFFQYCIEGARQVIPTCLAPTQVSPEYKGLVFSLVRSLIWPQLNTICHTSKAVLRSLHT